MDFLNAAGLDYAELVKRGYALYVTHIDIHYKNAAVLNDELVIETTPVDLKRVSGTYRQKISKTGGHVCAEADVTWACVLQDGVKLSPIPADLMNEALKP
ncbi:MAG: hypothetical protein Ta2A_09380 [Treponemataceae bacterium]|nr:MAG: hypothetical protein Ta2A_09380 [Treponemataceae bacterium]